MYNYHAPKEITVDGIKTEAGETVSGTYFLIGGTKMNGLEYYVFYDVLIHLATKEELIKCETSGALDNYFSDYDRETRIVIRKVTEAFKGSILEFSKSEGNSNPKMIVIDCRLVKSSYLYDDGPMNLNDEYVERVKDALSDAGYSNVSFNNTKRTFWVNRLYVA